MIKPISLRVQTIQNQVVSGKTSDGQVWRIPLSAIHGTPQVDQEVLLIATVPGSEDAGKHAFAQTLLNELIGSDKTT